MYHAFRVNEKENEHNREKGIRYHIGKRKRVYHIEGNREKNRERNMKGDPVTSILSVCCTMTKYDLRRYRREFSSIVKYEVHKVVHIFY